MPTRRGRIIYDGQVHAASWQPGADRVQLMCEDGKVKAERCAETTQPLNCQSCRIWARQVILSR